MLTVDDQGEDIELTLALSAAHRSVDAWCGCSFEPAGSVSQRRFSATWGTGTLIVDPFNTTSGLVVATDDNDDGTAETTWTVGTDYVVGSNSVGPDGRTGWPYTEIHAVGSKAWPMRTVRPDPVYVTADWGWAATPEPVTYATILLTHDLWKSRTAPSGVAGFGDYGAIRLRENQKVVELLAPYRMGRRIVGVG